MAKILVAEDDPAIAEMICDVLTEEGHEIVWARDGVDALARAAEGPFDLILADLMMPRLDGRSLRTALAAEPSVAQAPMILMTAASNLLDSDERLFAGVLAKPFYIDALLDALTQHLSPAIAGADPEEPK